MAVDGFVERGLVLRPFAPGVTFRAYLVFRPDEQRSRPGRDFAASLRAAAAPGVA